MVELKDGTVYRGHLADAEDNMNCSLHGVTATARDGRVMKHEMIYVRGSSVRFVVMPDLLKQASMFKRVQDVKAAREKVMNSKAAGRGRKK